MVITCCPCIYKTNRGKAVFQGILTCFPFFIPFLCLCFGIFPDNWRFHVDPVRNCVHDRHALFSRYSIIVVVISQWYHSLCSCSDEYKLRYVAVAPADGRGGFRDLIAHSFSPQDKKGFYIFILQQHLRLSRLGATPTATPSPLPQRYLLLAVQYITANWWMLSSVQQN